MCLTTAYLINRTLSSVIGNRTLYQMMYQKLPSYEYFKIFGSLCCTHNQNRGGDKFPERSRQYVFVGYPYAKKAWRLDDLEKMSSLCKKMLSSRSIFSLMHKH